MNNSYKRLVSAIGFAGLAQIVNLLITLVITPVITSSLGAEAYGFVTLAKHTAVITGYISVALNSFATRYISIEYHRENYRKANEYFSSTFFGDVFLAGAVLSAAAVIIIFLDKIFQVPVELVPSVRILFAIILGKTAVCLMMSANEAGPVISNRINLLNTFVLIAYITEAVLLFVMFRFFPAKIYYVGIATACESLIESIANLVIRKKYVKKLKISGKDFRFYAVKNLVMNGIWTSVNSFGSILNDGLDLIVSNMMLTPLAMGQLAIAEQIGLIFKAILTMVSNPFKPYYLKSYADGDKKKLLRQFSLASKTSSLLTNICFAGFTALGMVFYKLWIPNQDIALIYKITIIIILVSVTSGITYPLYYAYTLTLRKKIPCLFTLASGLLNVLGMYVLIRHTGLGIYAVVLTTLILMWSLHLVVHPLYLAHVLEIPKWSFYPLIARSVLSCIIMTAVFKAMTTIYMPSTWIQMILCACVMAVIGAGIHFVFALNKSEKEILLSKIRGRKI